MDPFVIRLNSHEAPVIRCPGAMVASHPATSRSNSLTRRQYFVRRLFFSALVYLFSLKLSLCFLLNLNSFRSYCSIYYFSIVNYKDRAKLSGRLLQNPSSPLPTVPGAACVFKLIQDLGWKLPKGLCLPSSLTLLHQNTVDILKNQISWECVHLQFPSA